MKCRKILFILLTCSSSSMAWADATHILTDAALGYDDNIGRSEYEQDRQEDFSIELGATISRSIRLNEKSGMALRAGLHLKEQFDYDDLSRISFNAGARYRLQPYPGFTAPWLEVSLDTERLEHRDSEIRDGWIHGFGIGIGKYFTDRLRASIGWHAQKRVAQEGRSYDISNQFWKANIDFRLTPKGSLYASAARIFGDQVSSAPQSTLGPNPLQPTAQTADPALQENGISRTAYRFDADTDTFELGYNHALTGSTAIDLSVRYFEADAKGGHTYHGTSARAGLLYQF